MKEEDSPIWDALPAHGSSRNRKSNGSAITTLDVKELRKSKEELEQAVKALCYKRRSEVNFEIYT